MQLSLTDEDGVHAVRDLHQALVDSSDADAQATDGQDVMNVVISYHMKDGSSVVRSYDVAPSGTAAHALDGFLRDDAVCQRVVAASEDILQFKDRTPLVMLSTYGLSGLGVEYGADGSESIVVDSDASDLLDVAPEDYPSLLAAIKEDVTANGAWCLMPYDEDAAILGDVILDADSATSDALIVYLSEERAPATLAWAQEQMS